MTERGQEWYFKTSPGEELLVACKKLRGYITAEKGTAPDKFIGMFFGGQPITAKEFDALTALRMENTGKVRGVFDVNFDKRKFSAVHIMDGWRTWAMRDVSPSVYLATRSRFASGDEQLSKLLELLDGMEITSAGHLSARNFSFSDEIMMEEDGKHIHVHMVIFSTDPKEGYLSRQGIRSIKSALVSTIYRNDRLHIYEQKDEQRGLLRQEAEARMAALIGQMAAGTLQSDKLELLVADLAQRLQEVSGKKVYGYLPPRVKRIVDEIVDELAKDERVSSAYALWQDLREQLCTDYNQTPPQRVPLSQQKEFKTVRNMVIRETLRLSEMHFTFEDDAMQDEPEPEEPPVPPDPSAERMIYQRARFYRRAKSILDAVDADPSEKSMALVTLHRLWEEGYTIAAHQLGKAYQDGLGKSYRDGVVSSVDQELAAEWFQKSAEAGNPCSAYALGKLLQEQEQFPQALHWLRQAAEQNDPYAQYRLGKLLLTGAEGVPKDIDAAIQLLKDSATQGNSFAQHTLGKLYLLGQEVQADREEALRYFAQAAAQGNTYAQYFIDHQEDFSGAAVGTAVFRMLHQMSRIFRENAAQPAIYAGMQIDKKRRRRLQEKRMAMGHKADDHEDISPQMQ